MLVFCEQVESVLGKKKFVAVYALAGIAGNVLSCVVNPRTPVRERSGEPERQAIVRRVVISRPFSCVQYPSCRTTIRFTSQERVVEMSSMKSRLLYGPW